MHKRTFSIEIKASREKVWNVLWKDATFRDWASIVDEGTSLIGDLKEGNTVQFVSSMGGFGVLSLVERLVPDEYISFKQLADIKDGKEHSMGEGKEWKGGMESYSLSEHAGVTTLTLEMDVPEDHISEFEIKIPKALGRIKALAEE